MEWIIKKEEINWLYLKKYIKQIITQKEEKYVEFGFDKR